MCIRMYNFCMEPQPNTCPSLSEHETVSTIVLNQCTNSVTIITHTKESTVTTYLPTLIYTPNYPLPTHSPTSEMHTPTSMYSPATETNAPTIQTVLLIIAAPAIGVLVVLLLVVITGWVCTCRIMKKRGKMEINIMQDR